MWCFVPSLVEIGPVVVEKKNENVKKKMYDNEEGNNNDDGQQTNFDQNSSLEPLWAKKDIGNITETVLENEEVNRMNKKKELFFSFWQLCHALTRKHRDRGGREGSLDFTATVFLVGSEESTVAA